MMLKFFPTFGLRKVKVFGFLCCPLSIKEMTKSTFYLGFSWFLDEVVFFIIFFAMSDRELYNIFIMF
jgi:hypothetical protein